MQNQILNNWQKVKLGDVAGVLGGYAFKSKWFNPKGNGSPVIKIQNLSKNGLIERNKIEFVDTSLVGSDLSRFKVKSGDYLVAMTGATAGKTAILKGSDKDFYLNQRVGKFFVKDPSKLDYKYLVYSISTPMNRAVLKKLADGSAQGNMSSTQIEESLELVIPPSIVQQRMISSILATFDDKIELNNKNAKTLEEMSQAIFKEWFVNFHFPGYEKVETVDTEFGKIPKGWIPGHLSDIAKITMGQSPLSKFYNFKGDGLPFHQGVTNFGSRFPHHEVYCTEKNRVAQKGDLLFSIRAPVGRINISDAEIVLGRGVAGIRHKDNAQSYIYYLLKRLFKKEDSLGGGSVFPSVTKADMENMKVLIPNQNVVKHFEETVRYMDQQIEFVEKENQKLSKLSDLLLPKLMKGEIIL